MHGLFLAALLFAGSALAQSSPDAESLARRQSSCVGTSNATWAAVDFVFEASYTTSKDNTTIPNGRVSFALENSSLSYRARCEAQHNAKKGFYDGTGQPYKCSSPISTDGATFTFDRETGELSITQGWICDQEQGRYDVTGSGRAKLDCETMTWTNGNYAKTGGVESIRYEKCQADSIDIKASNLAAVG